jgi:hypothetical protein
MTFNKQDVDALYAGCIEMSEKIEQAVRIKYACDVRRADQVARIKSDPHNPALVDDLLNLYSRESNFFDILERGINRMEEFYRESKPLAEQAGFMKNIFGLVKGRARFTCKEAYVASMAYDLIGKQMKSSKKQFRKIKIAFFDQFDSLKKIKAEKTDITFFLSRYEAELAIVNRHKTRRLMIKLMGVLQKLNPRRAAVLIGLLNLPGSLYVTPLTAPHFGMETAVTLGLLSEVVKWGSVVAFSYYAVKQ